MNTVTGGRDVPLGAGNRRALSVLMWISVSAAWLVSIISVIEEMCMVSACRDTASFTVFGFNMGWFGIAYFSLVLVLLWLRKSIYRLDWTLGAIVFTGIGAELRLLWIQKYIIGGWCPLCVTICCALLAAAILLVVEKVQDLVAGQIVMKVFVWCLALMVTMGAIGLAVALVGIKALY